MEDVSAYTPLQMDGGGGISTPLNTFTPAYNAGGFYSERQTPGATPGYDGGMSPGPGQAYGGSSMHMMSPSYQMTPNGQSPNYQPYQPYQSPIYQPGAGVTIGGMKSPVHQSSSPSYSPTNSRQSPSYGHHITPAYVASGQPASQSPAYYSSSSGLVYGTSGNTSG